MFVYTLLPVFGHVPVEVLCLELGDDILRVGREAPGDGENEHISFRCIADLLRIPARKGQVVQYAFFRIAAPRIDFGAVGRDGWNFRRA